jgi:hypothetical protein
MIQCPNCKNTLPDTFTQCQFCGADVTKVVRPAPTKKASRPLYEPPKWVWIAYFGIAGYWLIGGIMDVVRGLTSLSGAGAFAYIGIAFGAFTALVGIGLMARVELVRGIVNVICFLRIIFGLLGLWGALWGSLFLGPLALLFAVFAAFDIVTGILMIYLLGETEKSAPNM